MAATAGTIILKGASGVTYIKDVYVPDAAADVLRFDGGAGAGSASPDFMTFNENVVITDMSFAGAPTATRVRLTSNGSPSAHVLRYTIHAYNLNNRPQLMIPINAGNRVGGINIA